MTRDEAVTRLTSGDEVTYDILDEVFTAFGFQSEWENPDVTVYYHEDFIDCGSFRARDPFGWGTLTPRQCNLVWNMVMCVQALERR